MLNDMGLFLNVFALVFCLIIFRQGLPFARIFLMPFVKRGNSGF